MKVEQFHRAGDCAAQAPLVTLDAPECQCALPDGLYWDTLEAYHYVRLQPGRNSDYLIVGGGDHKTGEADDADARFLALEAWMRNLLPALGKEKHRWSGQIQDTIDYCAFIGLNPGNKHTYVATGDSGQGITHGAVAGVLISDLILKRESPWTDVYDPSRKPVMAVGTFASENLTVPKNFAEYVAPGEKSSWDELKPGEGAIVRKGLSKVAAYRDDQGKLFLRSARCPHLGCHVAGSRRRSLSRSAEEAPRPDDAQRDVARDRALATCER